MTLGERLKNARIQKEVKVKEMADLLNISERAYRNYESGERDIGTQALRMICDYLKVSSEYLLGISDCMEIKIQEQPTSEVNSHSTLSGKQRRIVELFNVLEEHQQDNVITYAETMAQESEPNKEITYEARAVAYGGANTDTEISESDLEKAQAIIKKLLNRQKGKTR